MSDIGRVINEKDGTPRGVIYQGDMTSHGGVVVGASGHMIKADGKVNARLGDMVTCPKCKPHIFPIVTADDTVIDWEISVPRHGDMIGCGALPIARAAPASAAIAAEVMRDIASYSYDEQAKLDHELIAGIPLYIEIPDGRTYSGRIDSGMHLPRIFTKSEGTYQIYWGDEALGKMNNEQA